MPRRLSKFLFPRTHPATAVLIVLNGIVLGAMLSQGRPADHPQLIIRFGALVKDLVWQGQYWRLLSAMFLHYNFIHFGLNMYALLVLGKLVEPLLGTPRFVVLYLLSGLSGAIGTLTVDHPISLGASGAIFGLVGALLALEYLAHGSLRALLTRTLLVPVVALELAFGARMEFIDNAAHTGGLLAGCAIGYFMAARLYASEVHRRRSTALLVVFSLLAVPGLFIGLRPPKDSSRFYLSAGARLLAADPGGREAREYLEKAVKLAPDSVRAWTLLAQACVLSKPPRTERALEAIRRARALPGASQDTKRKLARQEVLLLIDAYRIDDAIETLASARKAFPDEQDFRTLAANCLLDRGRLDEAMGLALEGLQHFPLDLACYMVIEQAARGLGRRDAEQAAHRFVRRQMEKAHRGAPDDGFAANNLAWTYADAGEELDQALALAQQAVQEKPDALYRLDTLAWVHFKRGDTKQAIALFEKIIKRDGEQHDPPQAHYAHYHLAEVLAAAGRRREALDQVRQALAIKRLFLERWAAQRLEQRLAAGLREHASRGKGPRPVRREPGKGPH